MSFLLMATTPNGSRKPMSWIASGMILFAACLSLYLLLSTWASPANHTRFEWFTIAGMPKVTAGILLDINTALMLVVVNVISFLVHAYSTAYMKDDEGYKKYFAFLGLFTFSMLGIIMADNLLIIFIFWELVGLSSYLLISHWYQKDSASKAAKKAFIVNRVGDAGFLIGLAILWVQFNTLDIEALKVLMQQSMLAEGQWASSLGHVLNADWLTIAGIALFLGAMGKSAQFPLQIWLPDAMEGPTPVSALIHAATMVAAGVFLMARIFVLLDIHALTFIATIGAITAFMGAVAALTQHDIKKVLAYSTISQLGYMLMGIGVGAYDAALFHLFTHAFFKACLFLAAGSVIYALHEFEHDTGLKFDAQDMRNMGGLRKKLPFTFLAYGVSSLALIGIPFFSGFLSKDALLSGAYAWADVMSGGGFSFYYLVPGLGFLTVVLTALYMFRQLLLVFFGDFRVISKHSDHSLNEVKEVPFVMKSALIILGIMSLGLVWSINPLDHSHSWFLGALKAPAILTPGFDIDWQPRLIELMFSNHIEVTLISITMIIIGALTGWYLYRPGSPYAKSYFDRKDTINKFQALSYNNWYLNEAYKLIIEKPLLWISNGLTSFEKRVIDRAIDSLAIGNVILAHLIGWIDRMVVDGFVNFSVFFAGRIGVMTKSLQGGKIQSYILIAVFGIVLMIFWIIW
ncbi:NADH-quinone oxidoreductase subunit L [Fulvivirga sp. 29W222]|uniref:NADH-quinone oxidoreductase subunit L n=1 Tax=Fulvivirga marina TaxID=2494733 RepID=A0A937FWS7_9BACT|nr:NADH-quinone oxidoreductase subunit L [Fulvivirga marina]